LSPGAAGDASMVGASADLEAICAAISEQVRLLDGVVRYRFRDDAELIAAEGGVMVGLTSEGEAARRGRVISCRAYVISDAHRTTVREPADPVVQKEARLPGNICPFRKCILGPR